MYLNPGNDACGTVKSGYRSPRIMKMVSILMVGGFMGVGTSKRLIDEFVRQQKRILTVIPNRLLHLDAELASRSGQCRDRLPASYRPRLPERNNA
jgi:hypothetical protein